MEEVVRVFSVFQREGKLADLRFVEEERDNTRSVQALSPYAAFVIRDILSDKASRWMGFGAAPMFQRPFNPCLKQRRLISTKTSGPWARPGGGRFGCGWAILRARLWLERQVVPFRRVSRRIFSALWKRRLPMTPRH
jgi:hypothetical protein